MPNQRVFITRRIPKAGLDLLKATPGLEIDLWQDELPPSYEVLRSKVAGIDGLLCLLTDRIDAAILDAAGPALKVVSQYAVGYDNIDIQAASQRRIPVGNTPGVLTRATADFTFALLMAAARRIVEADRYARAGNWKTWSPTTLLGPDISGATLGIVGMGRIGQAVARRARGFEMQILYSEPTPEPLLEQEFGATYASLDELLEKSNFISLHTPLTPSTRHLIGAAQFARMKPSAVLINTSRGPVVDPAALYDALHSHKIAAAALDVTDPEPLPLDSPLFTLDNLIIAPHIASASIQARDLMARMAVLNLMAGLRGDRLPNCANPQVY